MQNANRINILPPEISEKIAAGEVVDRPLSVVKELLENSIDGGADNIVVEIKNGGKNYIRVSDNGSGIKADQVENAFVRHGTSKIADLRDLDAISTLGFRGEALTSISAVSRLEMITKAEDEGVGSRILVEGGEKLERSPVGADSGTTVIVRDLFYNVPARIKFLKSDSAEAGLIIDFLSKMALAYPEISFRVINNQNLLFATDGRGILYDNLLKIYENQVVSSLLKVDYHDDSYELYGFISPPHVNRPGRSNQVNFVNGRSVKDRIMEEAIRSAYKERLETGRFPHTFLFLKVAPQSLDVNIHPNKLEIRHREEREVRDFLIKALNEALDTDKSFPTLPMKSEIDIVTREADIFAKTEESPVTTEQVDIKTLLSTKRAETIATHENLEKPFERADDRIFEKADDYSSKPKFLFSELTPLGSVFATYIIAISPEKMYLIDQHAAHERIIYEKFLKQYKSEDKVSQLLLAPLLIELSPEAIVRFKSWAKDLEAMGYMVEDFGGRTVLVKGIPGFMNVGEAEDFLRFYSDENTGENHEKTIAKACKAAIKANNLLNMEDMKNLLNELDLSENPYSCPHGRPTILSLTKGEIERLFKRA